ncbi:hypothetical protein B1H18_02275 [Streptomyces tsukubensis]|uniref:Mycothiol-dependent maleylpyruvate isomerase metal-binding domain-containing protein n=1 Tax=Streptomyces tsukubensis TaxID=83656 RepID=A0A1V4AGM8_9ACTN|nr:hypothetical protein B1H18_02275 [Streptomyces tsukubensis]
MRALDRVALATETFLATVAGLKESDVTAASLVPPWTRGHVISHVARAGDSLGRLLEWAATGVAQAQYASMDARAEEIEEGADRSVAALVKDVATTADRFDATVRALPPEAWLVAVTPRTGEPCTPERLVLMRLRELEVHHVDLACAYTFADVPEAAAGWIIGDIARALAVREGIPATRIEATDTGLCEEWGREGSARGAPHVRGGQSALLAWLTGRSEGGGLTVLGADVPGEVPPAPYWI